MSSMTDRSWARLQILGAALLFSTGGAAIKAVHFTGWQIAGLRSGVAAVAICLMVPGARRGWSWRTLLCGVAYATTLVLFVLANRMTTAANTIFLQSTAPLYVLLLSPLLLRERTTREDLWLMAAIFVGMSLFFVGAEAPARTAPDPLRGNILAALSGVSWALTLIGLRWLGRSGGRDDHAASGAVAAGNLLAFLFCLPFALPFHGSRPMDWVLIGYLGIFQIGLAYVFMTAGIRHLLALETSLLLLVEPALNPLWAFQAHGERPGPLSLCGGGLIILATLGKTYWDEKRK